MDDLALLETMLRIPSLSRQEGNLARFLCGELEERGFLAAIDAVGNVVGRRGRGGGPLVLLLGHMDTVPGAVQVRHEGNRLYGRGAVDAKGPLAAFIAAASALESDIQGEVIVVGAVEEEAATSRGARHIMERYAPDVAIIGEPSAWDRITIGYKGRLLAGYRIEQPMAHSAGEHRGVCEVAAGFWQAVQDAVERLNVERPRSVFERLQPSLRAMRSGSDGLTDWAELELGFRLPPNFDQSAWEDTLRLLAGTVSISFHGQEHAVLVEKNTAPARAFLAAIREEGGQPRYAVKTGTSDMNVVAQRWHCPMLAYGPGDAALDHTPDEHIERDEYLRAIRVLKRTLTSLLEPVQAVQATGARQAFP